MEKARQGDSVSVHYTGKFDDGTVFDSSREASPLSFTLGAGQVIPGFEKAVEGMTPGESRTTVIPASEGYGEYRDDLVLTIERSSLPAGMVPEVGQHLGLQQRNGDQVEVIVTDVTDDTVTLDANHPLAGEELTFDIELVQIG